MGRIMAEHGLPSKTRGELEFSTDGAIFLSFTQKQMALMRYRSGLDSCNFFETRDSQKVVFFLHVLLEAH